MKLKIRIKEVETTERELTVEESAMVAIVKDSSYNDTYSAQMEHKLKEIGFKEIIKGYTVGNPLKMETAIFRKETIRDATANEKEAWLNQELNKIGAKKSANVIWCAEELRDKEVILEVVE